MEDLLPVLSDWGIIRSKTIHSEKINLLMTHRPEPSFNSDLSNIFSVNHMLDFLKTSSCFNFFLLFCSNKI
jgi:hypothetical protein